MLRFLSERYVAFGNQFCADFLKPIQGKTRIISDILQHGRTTANGKSFTMNTNLFFATEYRDAVKLPLNQNFFTVTPFQSQPIDYTDWWPGTIERMETILEQDLPEYVGYLKHYPIDIPKTKQIV